MQLQICRLLLTFENSLDLDLAQHNFQYKLEQKMFDTHIIFSFWKNNQKTTTIKWKVTQHAKS